MMRKLVRSNDVVADRFLLLLSLELQLHALVSLLRLVDAGGGVSSLSLSGSIDVSQTLVSQPQGVFQLGFYSLQQSNTSSAGGADPAGAAYSLAIWYSQVVPITPVWMASRDVLLSTSAYLQLSADGVLRLFLSAQNHQAVWQSSNIEPTTTTVSAHVQHQLIILAAYNCFQVSSLCPSPAAAES
jgi:hypothetical protein